MRVAALGGRSANWRNFVSVLHPTHWASFGSRLIPILMTLCFAFGLAACQPEEANICFATGDPCDDAEAYSEFFAQGVPCCEGSCDEVPGPPDSGGNPTLVLRCVVPQE